LSYRSFRQTQKDNAPCGHAIYKHKPCTTIKKQ